MSFQYVASGGVPPYAYTITGGALPPGLSLNTSTGALTGTPTAAGDYSFQVRAQDSVGASGYLDDDVFIAAGALSITGDAPNGNAGSPYSFTYTTAGGTAPYVYAVTTGSLPPGVTLNASTGQLSGAPTTVGSYSWTITVTSNDGQTAHVDDASTIAAVVAAACIWDVNKTTDNVGGFTFSTDKRTATHAPSGYYQCVLGTVSSKTGKKYFEVVFYNGDNSNYQQIGLSKTIPSGIDSHKWYIGADANGWAYYQQTGEIYHNDVGSAYGATFRSGDIIGVGYDASTGQIEFFKNGVSQGIAYTIDPGTELYPSFSPYPTDCYGELRANQYHVKYLPSGYSTWVTESVTADPWADLTVAHLKFENNYADTKGAAWTPSGNSGSPTFNTTTPLVETASLVANTGQCVHSPSDPRFAMGDEDYTLEFKARIPLGSTPAGTYFFDGDGGNRMVISFTPTGRLCYYDPSAGTNGPLYQNGPMNTDICDGNVVDICFTRCKGVGRLFARGHMYAEQANVNFTHTESSFWLNDYGANGGSGVSGNNTCTYDELRITKGTARYLRDYTPNPGAFADHA